MSDMPEHRAWVIGVTISFHHPHMGVYQGGKMPLDPSDPLSQMLYERYKAYIATIKSTDLEFYG